MAHEAAKPCSLARSLAPGELEELGSKMAYSPKGRKGRRDGESKYDRKAIYIVHVRSWERKKQSLYFPPLFV